MNLAERVAIALIVGAASLASAGSAPKTPETISPAAAVAELNQSWMIEGEQRFRANCGRCHQPPHKLSPREMAMAVRQMRVRAMLTDDDMKFILYYVTH